MSYEEEANIPPQLRALVDLFKGVEEIVASTAQEKGYIQDGDGGRALLDFVDQQNFPHAEGEVIYKLVRWNKKSDPQDLVKAVAWIYLIWEQQRRQAPAKEEAPRTRAAQGVTGQTATQMNPDPTPGYGYSDYPAPTTRTMNLPQDFFVLMDSVASLTRSVDQLRSMVMGQVSRRG